MPGKGERRVGSNRNSRFALPEWKLATHRFVDEVYK
jgi:hypothetical protein